MIILLTISCLLKTKVVLSQQVNTMNLYSQINPYLLTQEKKFCELFDKQIINIEISVGDVIFQRKNILYSSLKSLELYPNGSTKFSDIGSSTIATFHLTLTTELLDQHGQIDTLVVRHYDRLSCFEKGVILYDESSLTFDFGRQDCQFDPGETTFQVDLFRYGQTNSIYSQDLGVQDFPGLQFQKITLDCHAGQTCQNLIRVINSQSVIFGYYQFSTTYHISKKYQYFDNTGVTHEAESQMLFLMINLVEIKFARAIMDDPPHGTIVVLKDCLMIDLPGQYGTGRLEVVFKGQMTSIEFFSHFPGGVFEMECGVSGCLGNLRNQFQHFEIIEAYSYLRIDNAQKFLIALQQVNPCFIKTSVNVMNDDICAVFEKDGNCEFFYGYVEAYLVIDGRSDLLFRNNFNISHMTTSYCFRNNQQMNNHIRITDVVTGVFIVNNIRYSFSGVDVLLSKGRLIYGWVVVGITIIVLTVITVLYDRRISRNILEQENCAYIDDQVIR